VIISLIIEQVIVIVLIRYQKHCFSALGLNLFLLVVVVGNIVIDPFHCIVVMNFLINL